MALHFQMSEEAEEALRKAALRNKLSSMAACLGLLGGGCLILAMSLIYIAVEQEAEFIAYTPPADNLPPSAAPTTQQLSSKAATPSSVVSPAVIVATGAAPVAMAQVDVPMDDSEDIGMSVDIDLSMDMDLGELGEEGAGMGSSEAGGSALTGTFYDLKLTKSGATSKIGKATGGARANEVHKILHDFLSRNWNKSVLNSYYQSPTPLYASSFMLPSCKATYAPIAYKCQDKCKDTAWLAVYRGKVRAPMSGTFRFVGTGDDLLCVRFDGKTVLEAGWCIPSAYDSKAPGKCGTMGAVAFPHGQQYHKAIRDGKDKDHRDYEFITFKDTPKWNKELGGLTAGTPIKVKQGEVYPIEILVSEIPGGAFGFALLIQEEKQIAKKQFDLFHTNFSLPDVAELESMLKKANSMMGAKMEMPAYNQDSLIWVSVP